MILSFFGLILLYSMVVLLLGIMEIQVFLAKEISQKPASQYHPGALAVLVKYKQAQKCFQYNPKGFQ